MLCTPVKGHCATVLTDGSLAYDVLALDGKWGKDTSYWTQKWAFEAQKDYQIYIDSKISRQPSVNRKYLPAAMTSSWEFKLFKSGYAGGSNTIRVIQTLIGADPDGLFGAVSIARFIEFLYVKGYEISEKARNKNVMDESVVKAWQSYINKYWRGE